MVYFYYGNPNAAAGNQAADFTQTAFSQGTVTQGSETVGPGPVAYWQFNQGYGTTTTDSTQNKLIGTLSGTTIPTWQSEDMCISGKCLYYDGSTSHVSVPDPGTGIFKFLSGDSITVEAWVNPASLPTSGNYVTLVTKGSMDGTPDATFMLQIGNSGGNYFIAFCYASSGGSTLDECWETDHARSLFTANTWQHMAFTFTYGTGSTATAYYNGLVQNVGSWHAGDGSAAPKATSKALWISGDQNSGGSPIEVVNGKIDEVKIYHYARTAAQIKADYASRGTSKGASAVLGANDQNLSAVNNGLVGNWNFNENTGTSATDRSGNGNTGTWNGTGAHWANGKFGSAASFNGTDDYVAVTQNSGLAIYNSLNYTISFWVNAAGNATDK